ncbi:hypothetical protein [Nannocystis pusilla]|uniref:hypothetical protein n=1 Tax=Nannocystis pusilla TaxID=889268 RepID=UPI003B7935D8
MATFTGTVRKNDLEGGFHELVTDKGDVYRLSKCSVKAGARVKVEGNVESGVLGSTCPARASRSRASRSSASPDPARRSHQRIRPSPTGRQPRAGSPSGHRFVA